VEDAETVEALTMGIGTRRNLGMRDIESLDGHWGNRGSEGRGLHGDVVVRGVRG